jgi:hypothetical protein
LLLLRSVRPSRPRSSWGRQQAAPALLLLQRQRRRRDAAAAARAGPAHVRRQERGRQGGHQGRGMLL